MPGMAASNIESTVIEFHHELVAFDKRSEAVAFTFRVPESQFRQVALIANVPEDDPVALYDYALTSQQARAAIRILGVRVKADKYDFFLETRRD